MEKENDSDSHGDEGDQGSNHSAENRWNLDDLDGMDFVCTFLENDEDNLPDFYDTKKVQKKKSDTCQLCSRQLSKITTGVNKKQNCKYCGMCICSLCSQNRRRLSKLDKEKHRVCDQCDTLLSNVNFEQMYINCLENQKNSLSDLKKQIQKKEQQLKETSKQLEKQTQKYEAKMKAFQEKEEERKHKLEKYEKEIENLKKENEDINNNLNDIQKTIEMQEKDIALKRKAKKELKLEQVKIESQRLKTEEELKTQNYVLKQVQEEEYGSSFQENQIVEVDDIDRRSWRAPSSSDLLTEENQ